MPERLGFFPADPGSFIHALFKGKGEKGFGWFALGARMPLAFMNAEHAARKIVSACRVGQPAVTLGVPAKLARVASSVLPNLSATALSWVSSLLPDAEGGEGKARLGLRFGKGDRSSRKFNEDAAA